MKPPTSNRPLYVRVLRLRHLHPSGVVCFLLLEGMVALGVLLALAELASWWAALVLPAVVAAMVKANDLIAGALGGSRPADSLAGRVAGRATVAAPTVAGSIPPARATRQVSRDLADTLDPVDSPRQRFRQSAQRRYE